MKRLFEVLLLVACAYALSALWSRYSSTDPLQEPPSGVAAATTFVEESTETEVALALAPQPAHLSDESGIKMPKQDIVAMQKINAHYMAGDYVTTLNLADQYLEDSRSPAFHNWLAKQMHVIVLTVAWTKLKLGLCDEAIPLFRRAEELKRSPETAKGLAYCFYKERALSSAEDELSWYLRQKPDDPQVMHIYADVLESSGRFDEAYEMIRKERELTEDKAEKDALEKKMLSMRKKISEGALQQTISSTAFVLTYRSEEHKFLAERVLAILDRSLLEFIDLFGFREPRSQIEILLYPDENFLGLVDNSPAWAEGIFDGRLRIPIKKSYLDGQNIDPLEQVIRHELIHALLSHMTDFRPLPPWFDEGLAQRASCPAGVCPHFRFMPIQGNFLKKDDFISRFTGYDAGKAKLAYQQSLYLLLVLEHTKGRGKLREIVENIKIDSILESDSILKPADLTFDQLIQLGQRLWTDKQKL